MRCLELLVPALFWPDAAALGNREAIEAPALDALFARGARQPQAGPGVDTWLARRFDLDLDQELPLAAIGLAGDGGAAAGRIWLRADPVHLHAQGTELYLTRGAELAIQAHEADAMVAALNELFSSDGLRFDARHPHQWYLALDHAPKLRTTPLELVHGRSIGPLLPAGDDAAWWQQRISEAQMLLHGLPVNEAREARGDAPVNSLWIWGAGALPARISRVFDAVYSRDAVARGFATVSGARVDEPVATAAALLRSDSAETRLVRLDDAGDAAARGDFDAWREAISALSTDWVRPALEAMHRGRLGRLTLTGFAGRTGLTVSASRRDLWRFWRPRVPYASWRPTS
jgi:hypothetical protein